MKNILFWMITLVILVNIMLVNLSCDIKELSNDYLLPLESRILFEVVELHSNTEAAEPPEIFIVLRTEKIYPCLNHSLVTRFSEKTGSINISLLGIKSPQVCLTALGPAGARIKLSPGSGEHNLFIYSKDFTSSYKLTVTDESISVSGTDTADTKPLTRVVWRYPKNSFAYLCGTTTDDKEICDEFLDTLKSKLEITEFQFPAGVKIPYPRSSSGYYYNMPARYFYYKSEEDFDKSRDILKAYAESKLNNKQGIGISLINWLGKQYYSWAY